RAQCKRESGIPSTDSIPCRAPTLLHENLNRQGKAKVGHFAAAHQSDAAYQGNTTES
ncbi:hypothetical protein M9458_018424, partial [Cirrhinus mrigala]